MVERLLTFDASAYTLDAIQRAVYRFSDRLSADISIDREAISCRLFIHDAHRELLDELIDDFRNEVLDQVLRERIRRETEPVRNLILAHAFSNTTVVEPD